MAVAKRTLELSGLRVEPSIPTGNAQALDAERNVKDRHRYLLVAATGTGKTVVAALDYRTFSEAGRRPRLLFIAHQERILKQAQRTYRGLIRSWFRRALVGGQRPHEWDFVFASVQSLKQSVLDRLPAKHFDFVVIDEFHHAEAATYRRLLDHLEPKELLGLTATPSGPMANVQKFFDYRSPMSCGYGMLHWLLTPMHYYGIADGTDLSSLTWNRTQKAYDTAGLSDLMYAGESAQIYYQRDSKRVLDISQLKAWACVSIAHAEYMAAQFNIFGLPARAVHGGVSLPQRQQAIADLRSGVIKAIFSILSTGGYLSSTPCCYASAIAGAIYPTARPWVEASTARCLRGLDFIGQQNNYPISPSATSTHQSVALTSSRKSSRLPMPAGSTSVWTA